MGNLLSSHEWELVRALTLVVGLFTVISPLQQNMEAIRLLPNSPTPWLELRPFRTPRVISFPACRVERPNLDSPDTYLRHRLPISVSDSQPQKSGLDAYEVFYHQKKKATPKYSTPSKSKFRRRTRDRSSESHTDTPTVGLPTHC